MPNSPEHLSTPSSISSTPSFVESIDLDVIANLASDARYRSMSQNVACKVSSVPKIGAFNVVWFIDFEDEVQWVIRTPILDWSPILEKRLRSDIITIQLIQNRTNLPIPALHDFSIATQNAIGRPYMFFDRVKGTQLCNLWFDSTWFTAERRQRVFRSIASVMLQLKALEFPYIGSLEYDSMTNSHVVAPLLPSIDDISNGNTRTRGPYSTVHEYLFDSMISQTSADNHISLSLLRLFAGALPDHSLDGPPFVLSMPDFNYQNVFVDEDGNVTGLIDWDGAMIGSRQGGYARYPSWITRDWDPLLYGYPDSATVAFTSKENDESVKSQGGNNLVVANDYSAAEREEHPFIQIPSVSREELQEDSPETLQAFRNEYLSVVEELDPVAAHCTRNSHVYEALEIAITTPFCRGHILDRLTEYVFGGRTELGDPISSWMLEQGLRAGDWGQALNSEESKEIETR